AEDAIDLAQLGREPAVPAQVQALPVLGQQVQAGDLVARHVRERIERGAQDLLDVQRAPHGLGDRVEDLEVPPEACASGHRPCSSRSTATLPLRRLASRTMSAKHATTRGSHAPASASDLSVASATAVGSAALYGRAVLRASK